MVANNRTVRSFRRAFILNVVVLGALSTAVSSAAAADGNIPSGPQLSVAIDDGHKAAAVGDKLTYTITVRNLGSGNVTGLDVTQTVPAGLRLGSTDPAASRQASDVSWRLDLKAAGQAAFHTTMTVDRTPPDLLRLASVACVSMLASSRPLVCAAHSDQLPSGATADAGHTAVGSATGQSHRYWWYVACGVIALCVVGAVLLLRRRRTRAAR